MRSYTHIGDTAPVNARWPVAGADTAVIELGEYDTGEIALSMSRAKTTELRDALTDLLGEEGAA